MHSATDSSHSYDFRRKFSDICKPGLDRFLSVAGQDADRRAGCAKTYTRSLWRALKEAQGNAEFGEPWSASRAAEIAAELEVDAIDAERRVAADPRCLRPFGGGEAFDRAVARESLCCASIADQNKWGAEAVEAFLPIAKAARGGKDDDPASEVHIDALASTFVWRFMKAKKGGTTMEALDSIIPLRRAKEPPEAVPADEVLPVFTAASLAGRPVPPREWAVPSLIPFDTVTMLSGDGGVGKSLLAAQLAVAFASGSEWVGLQPERGPVVFVSAEDDRDELHRRVATIAESEGVDLADLYDLHIVPLAGLNAVMGATEGRSGVVKETAVWRGLVRLVERVKPHLVILDTLADAFAGNELARTEARQFIGQLRGLAIEHKLAVLLLSHPSLSGLNSGTGTSGSTAWSNSAALGSIWKPSRTRRELRPTLTSASCGPRKRTTAREAARSACAGRRAASSARADRWRSLSPRLATQTPP